MRQYTLYEIGLIPLVATGVGEHYTLVDEEARCSLTDAGRESCSDRRTEKQK